jgi:Glycosyl transferases group 1
MRIAMINVPIPAPWLGRGSWITVPPQGYGGIQWVVANLIEGMLELGHQVVLLGAPGSAERGGLKVINEAGTPGEIGQWLRADASFDIVHDHSNGVVFNRDNGTPFPYLATYHLTGRPTMPKNVVYLSCAQRKAAGDTAAPIIPIPVVTAHYRNTLKKDDYLLFLGRVSPWKGVLEAAKFAKAVGLTLRIAGPTWDAEYRRQIQSEYSAKTDWRGEVGGIARLQLLGQARALLVLSQSLPGPWGNQWVEPGSTVVSEAAASGTPVIASENGCLSEIVPGVGVILKEHGWDVGVCIRALATLPSPDEVAEIARERWCHLKIARRYVDLYVRAIRGEHW